MAQTLGTSRTRRSRYGADGMGRSVRTLRLRRVVIGASGPLQIGDQAVLGAAFGKPRDELQCVA
jgi:hypothetical protein